MRKLAENSLWAKTINCREVTIILCCFMFLFLWVIISFLIVCTVLLFVMFVIEVLFLLFRSVFVCSICKFVGEFSFGSRWIICGLI
jgi:hypothetical protein